MSEFSTATHEEKVQICKAIDCIWFETQIAQNKPENLNEKVIKVLNKAMLEVRNCSKQILITDFPNGMENILLALMYDTAFIGELNKIRQVHKTIKDNNWEELISVIGLYGKWFDVMISKRNYKICLTTAALNYRSEIEIAFMDL